MTGNYELAVNELEKIYNAQPKAAFLGLLLYDYELSHIQQYEGFRNLVNKYK